MLYSSLSYFSSLICIGLSLLCRDEVSVKQKIPEDGAQQYYDQGNDQGQEQPSDDWYSYGDQSQQYYNDQ
jgi:hypothetical protein